MRRLFGGRLYGRLLLWFCVANLVTLLVSVFVTERLARISYHADPDWAEMAQEANDAWIDHGLQGLRDWSDELRHRGFDANLLEGERNLLGRPPGPRMLPPELQESDSAEFRPRPGLRVIGQRVTGRDGVTRQLVVLRRPGPPPPRMEQVLATQIGISILVIGFVGWWLARSIARPVAGVQDAARRFAGGELTARVPPQWTALPDEIGDLARDFDRMAARIETLVTSERSVLQDVSHELRSPLARLHLLLDLAQNSTPEAAAPHFRRAEQEIARLDNLIGDALALSRLEADLPGAERLAFELDARLRECIADWQLEAQARGIALDLVSCEELSVDGAEALIARALDNLLSNAVKFSDAGGRVVLSLVRDGGQALLSVRDHGPGVPEAELSRLFQPFFRGSNAERADGHGLGLAIVMRIVAAHGGSVSASNADGGGLAVLLRLPLSPTTATS